MTYEWHPTQAIGPDGKRADIRDVANGLNCHCFCFNCKRKVVAKQGQKTRWHFAHHVASNCKPTPESELHFFAKELLAERLQLWVPANKVQAEGKSVTLSEQLRFEFKDVRVEQQDGNVRPDLILIAKGGQECHVEIFVRHKVDSIKLAKLQARNISSFEIDLSRLGWDDRSGWELAILETAPRRWLHNSKAAEAERKIVGEARAEALRKAKMLEGEVGRISAILADHLATSKQFEHAEASERSLACSRGFHSMINRPVKGGMCFAVSDGHWQSRLVNRFLWDDVSSSKTIFETKDALAHVRDLVRPGLLDVSREATDELTKIYPNFASPWHAVHEYLKWLKTWHHMFDKTVIGKQWRVSSSAVHHKQQRQNEWQKERDYKERLTNWVESLFPHLPKSETQAFDVTDWVSWFSRSYDQEEAYDSLDAVWRMVVEGNGLAEDCLNLPLAAEYERQEKSQAERKAQERHKREIEMEEARRANRMKSIRQKVHERLIEPDLWLETPNADLADMTPLSLAEQSDEALSLVNDALDQEIALRLAKRAEQEDRERRALLLDSNRKILLEEAVKREKTDGRGQLWYRTPNEFLTGVRPKDYCVDEPALRHCLRMMPKQI